MRAQAGSVPVRQPHNWQREPKALFPFRRVSRAETVVNLLAGMRVTVGWLIPAQAQQQSAFLRIVHMPMQDKGINAREPFGLFVGVTKRRRLKFAEPSLSCNRPD